MIKRVLVVFALNLIAIEFDNNLAYSQSILPIFYNISSTLYIIHYTIYIDIYKVRKKEIRVIFLCVIVNGSKILNRSLQNAKYFQCIQMFKYDGERYF